MTDKVAQWEEPAEPKEPKKKNITKKIILALTILVCVSGGYLFKDDIMKVYGDVLGSNNEAGPEPVENDANEIAYEDIFNLNEEPLNGSNEPEVVSKEESPSNTVESAILIDGGNSMQDLDADVVPVFNAVEESEFAELVNNNAESEMGENNARLIKEIDSLRLEMSELKKEIAYLKKLHKNKERAIPVKRTYVKPKPKKPVKKKPIVAASAPIKVYSKKSRVVAPIALGTVEGMKKIGGKSYLMVWKNNDIEMMGRGSYFNGEKIYSIDFADNKYSLQAKNGKVTDHEI